MREKGEMSLLIQGRLRQAHDDERDSLITQLCELRVRESNLSLFKVPICKMVADKSIVEATGGLVPPMQDASSEAQDRTHPAQQARGVAPRPAQTAGSNHQGRPSGSVVQRM